MSEFYSSHMLALHVSDLTGPSSGAFVYKLYVQIWYVVIRVLLDTSSRNGWRSWLCLRIFLSLCYILLMLPQCGGGQDKTEFAEYVLVTIRLRLLFCSLLSGILKL